MTDRVAARLKEIRARCEAATEGPWVFGYWTILDSDREAQRIGEPYWTLFEADVGFGDIVKGPFKRKSKDTERILSGAGWDCDGIDASDADIDFVTHSRTDLPALIDALEIATQALEQITTERDMKPAKYAKQFAKDSLKQIEARLGVE